MLLTAVKSHDLQEDLREIEIPKLYMIYTLSELFLEPVETSCDITDLMSSLGNVNISVLNESSWDSYLNWSKGRATWLATGFMFFCVFFFKKQTG